MTDSISPFMRHGIVLLAALVIPLGMVQAQELNCQVSVNIQGVTGSEYTFLRDLGQEVERYLNERSWTEDRYEEIERIDCLVQIIFEEAITLTSFRARLVLSSRRPIYGVPQVSTVLQINDADWQFNYAQGTPLIFDLERYDALTSVLDFYAFIILGYDYDTFDEYGGSPHFQRARRIAELADAQGGAGWSSLGDDRGRLDLIEQVLDPRFRALRKAYFDYHYGGLDQFVTETDKARQNVLTAIESLEDLYDEVSRQYVFDLFFGSKAEELAAIFEDSQLENQAYDLLRRIDPANLSKYDKLVN